MRNVPILRYFPELQNQWVPLIQEMTPVYHLKNVSNYIGHKNLFIKREDLTDSLYGGNKVRNLEFLLGDLTYRKYKKILTIAPLGSNFIAALAAQASKFNLPVEVHHFIPSCTPQMIQHAQFTKKMGAHLNIQNGNYLTSLLNTGLNYSSRILATGPNTYRMPIGGSDPIGTLGPLNAFLELHEQIKRNEIPTPDYILVGAGTCGTMAGLLAGKMMTGLPIKIIGIRCVDKIICNQFRISQLANNTLKYLNLNFRISTKDVNLHDYGFVQYGNPSLRANELISMFQETESISLDTTYTTKVVQGMIELVKSESFKNKSILYWHTFSPSAMKEKLDPSFLFRTTKASQMSLKNW